MTCAAIIQARLGSTRLPGKILLPLAGRPVLAHVIQRAGAIAGVDQVVVATTDNPSDDPVAELALRLGAGLFRGSETDVLARYHGAAETCGADRVVRVTSDNPLLDPVLCGRVLALLDGGADYACNSMPLAWPQGAGCECFTRQALDMAFRQADTPYQREHVTPWIRAHEGFRRANLPGPDPAWAGFRWTLDYPEDLEYLRAIAACLPQDGTIASLETVIALLAANPRLNDINACRREPGADAR